MMLLPPRWRYAPVVASLLGSGFDTLPAGLVSVDQTHKGHCKQATVKGSELTEERYMWNWGCQ